MTSKGNLIIQYILPILNYGGLTVDDDHNIMIDEETMLMDPNTNTPVKIILTDSEWIDFKLSETKEFIFDPFKTHKTAAYLGALVRDVLNEEFNEFDDDFDIDIDEIMTNTFLQEDTMPIQLIEKHAGGDEVYHVQFIDVKSANVDLDKDGTKFQYWTGRSDLNEKVYGEAIHLNRNLAIIGACVHAIQKRIETNKFVVNYRNETLDLIEKMLVINDSENKALIVKFRNQKDVADIFHDELDEIDVDKSLHDAIDGEFNLNFDLSELSDDYFFKGGNRINKKIAKQYTRFDFIDEELNPTDYGGVELDESEETLMKLDEVERSKLIDEQKRNERIQDEFDLNDGIDFIIDE